MKKLLGCILCFFALSFYAQENEVKDSLITSSEFIRDYTNRLNVKLEVSNEVPAYKIPFEGTNVKIEPNLGL